MMLDFKQRLLSLTIQPRSCIGNYFSVIFVLCIQAFLLNSKPGEWPHWARAIKVIYYPLQQFERMSRMTNKIHLNRTWRTKCPSTSVVAFSFGPAATCWAEILLKGRLTPPRMTVIFLGSLTLVVLLASQFARVQSAEDFTCSQELCQSGGHVCGFPDGSVNGDDERNCK